MNQKLFLLFHIGHDRYALQASDVAVVLPLAPLKQVPGAPPTVAGLFSYGGQSVPVLDITYLAHGRPAAVRMSTRLVLIHYALPQRNSALLGLVLEKATDTLRCDPADFQASGLDHDDAPYLGPVLRHRGELLQWITVDALLDERTRALLFPVQPAGEVA